MTCPCCGRQGRQVLIRTYPEYHKTPRYKAHKHVDGIVRIRKCTAKGCHARFRTIEKVDPSDPNIGPRPHPGTLKGIRAPHSKGAPRAKHPKDLRHGKPRIRDRRRVSVQREPPERRAPYLNPKTAPPPPADNPPGVPKGLADAAKRREYAGKVPKAPKVKPE